MLLQTTALLIATAIVLISVFSYGDARSIREQEYHRILDARRQVAHNNYYHRQPGYAESNYFTAEEAAEMRKARKEEREELMEHKQGMNRSEHIAILQQFITACM